MDEEQLLHDLTYKDHGISIGQRVYYALVRVQKPSQPRPPPPEVCSIESDRAVKLLGVLIQHLVESGKLSPEDLDRMLLEVLY